MSQRTVIALVIALVVLVVLANFGGPGGSSTGGAGDAFLPDLAGTLERVDKVTVVKANGETVARLEKRTANWVAADRNDYPVNVVKLRQALTSLGEAKVLEQKTANPELHGRLGVEDVTGATAAGISVAISAGDTELANIVLGNAEGSRYRYVRRAADAQSYLIDKNPDVPRAAAQWLESQIVDVRPERVRQVTITHADGEVVTISKAGPELTNFDVAAVPRNRELLYPGVANVVGNGLRELNLEDVEPTAAAATVGTATTVEYRTFDGLVVRVTGTKSEDASWIALEASVDAEQVARAAATATPAAATPAPAVAPADGAAAAAAPAAPAAAPPPDPSAEAARINAKVGGWRYKIAGYQYDQMTRRMADLLKPPPAA